MCYYSRGQSIVGFSLRSGVAFMEFIDWVDIICEVDAHKSAVPKISLPVH